MTFVINKSTPYYQPTYTLPLLLILLFSSKELSRHAICIPQRNVSMTTAINPSNAYNGVLKKEEKGNSIEC